MPAFAAGPARAPLPRGQTLRRAPVCCELPRAVAQLGGEQAVVHREHLVAAGGSVEPAHESAVGRIAEGVLELVAITPLFDRRDDRLELEALEAANALERLAHLGLLDLQLTLVGDDLPGDPRVRSAGGDPLGARREHLDGARVGVAALALVHDRPHAVAGDRTGDEHHVAAAVLPGGVLAQPRHALAAERQRVDLELQLIAALRPSLGGRRAHCAPTSSSSSAFWACRLFSAWSQMRWRSP